MSAFVVPFITALVLVGPGLLLASFRRDSDGFQFISEAVLYASLVDSAIFWIKPLQSIPLPYYTAFLVVVTLAALPVVYHARKRLAFRIPTETTMEKALAVGTVLALCCYLIISLTRAIIDWDAITYYLFSAIGFVTAGHVSSVHSNTITIGKNIPMAFPPVLPTMYAEAIVVAGWMRSGADAAVRLIPVVYLVGLASSLVQLTRRYVPRASPLASVFALLLMPVVINYMVAQALSLDMLNAFAFTFLTCLIVSYDGRLLTALQIGLCASLVVLSKVTGPVLIAFLAIAALGWIFPVRFSRMMAGVFCLAVFVSTWFVNPSASDSGWFYLACALLCVATVSCVARKRSVRPSPDQAAPRPLTIVPSPELLLPGLVAALALLPAAAYLYDITTAVGSPGTFFLKPTHITSPHYDWAFQALKQAKVFDSMDAPGLPQNYGLAIFLWWGPPPIFICLSFIAAITAIRRRDDIAFIVVPLALFDLCFLTLFGEGDFRRLLPTAPLIAVLVIYALYNVSVFRRFPVAALFVAVATAFPFSYTAQQTILNVPLALITGLHFDQWNAATDDAMRNAALYVGLILTAALAAHLVFISRGRRYSKTVRSALALREPDNDEFAEYVVPVQQYFRRMSARFRAAYREFGPSVIARSVGYLLAAAALLVVPYAVWKLFAGFDPWPAFAAVPALLAALVAAVVWPRLPPMTPRRKRLAAGAAISAVVVAGCFEPVIATAASPGLSMWARQVYDNQYFGYLVALKRVSDVQHSGSALVFNGFGVPWFTEGRIRRVELVDSFDLGLLKDDLQQLDGEALLKGLARYDVRSAIVPAPEGALRTEYDRLTAVANLQALRLLDDPALAAREGDPNWNSYAIYPQTTGPVPNGFRVGILSNQRFVDVTDRIVPLHGQAVEGIRILVPAARRTDVKAVQIHYSITGVGSDLQPKSQELVRSVRPADLTAIDVPIADLTAAATVHIDVQRLDIHSVEVDLRGDPPGVIDWRSPRFTVAKAGFSWVADHAGGMFAAAERTPISRLRLADSQVVGGIELFPGDVRSFGEPGILNQDLKGDYPNIVLDLVSTAACPPTAAYDVRVDGLLKSRPLRSGRFETQRSVFYTARTRPGKILVLDLRRLYTNANPVVPERLDVSSLTVAGTGAGCSSFERLAFPQFAIRQNALLSYSAIGGILEPNLTRVSI